ncbi:MAG: hypothetical protein H5U22_26515 [Rhizobium sp.]|nr:hypothetical protein [Parvibaculum sp.]MBC7152927.1 hypothetical protein [Rhizobium sp.]
MSSRFTALPLPSGEAFLLETDYKGQDFVVLVDSGRRYAGTNPLVTAIHDAAPHIDRIDVAICTHQDADHANGFRTFADQWCGNGNTIGEFWLPGRWAVGFPSVLTNPIGLVTQIREGAESAENRRLVGEDRERLGRDQSGHEKTDTLAPLSKVTDAFREYAVPDWYEDISREDRLATSLGVSADQLSELRAEIEETDSYHDDVFRVAEVSFRSLLRSWLFDEPYERIEVSVRALQALDVAKSISSIARAALRWSIPIRWFDFGLFESTEKPSGGIAGFLKPICSVELSRPPVNPSSDVVFLALALSRQNVESLVFYRVENSREPGVLFLGDSRLSFGLASPKKDFEMPAVSPVRQIIATAAHHGSQVNDHAYEVINQWASGSPLYIRNGGEHNQTLHEFHRQAFRRCAVCRECAGRRTSRRVVVGSVGNEWSWPPLDGAPCPRTN